MLEFALMRFTRKRSWSIIAVVATASIGTAIGLCCQFAHHMNIEGCAENLHQIGLAILLYTHDGDHQYPDTFQLHLNGMIPLVTFHAVSNH